MVLTELSQQVRRFVTACIDTVEDLEVLLLLQRTSGRGWTARDVAGELGISETLAASALERLGSRNLLDVRIMNDVLYRFSPGTADLERDARALAEAYQLRRAAVLSLVASRPASAIRTFADAFRVKGQGREDT